MTDRLSNKKILSFDQEEDEVIFTVKKSKASRLLTKTTRKRLFQLSSSSSPQEEEDQNMLQGGGIVFRRRPTTRQRWVGRAGGDSEDEGVIKKEDEKRKEEKKAGNVSSQDERKDSNLFLEKMEQDLVDGQGIRRVRIMDSDEEEDDVEMVSGGQARTKREESRKPKEEEQEEEYLIVCGEELEIREEGVLDASESHAASLARSQRQRARAVGDYIPVNHLSSLPQTAMPMESDSTEDDSDGVSKWEVEQIKKGSVSSRRLFVSNSSSSASYVSLSSPTTTLNNTGNGRATATISNNASPTATVGCLPSFISGTPSPSSRTTVVGVAGGRGAAAGGAEDISGEGTKRRNRKSGIAGVDAALDMVMREIENLEGCRKQQKESYASAKTQLPEIKGKVRHLGVHQKALTGRLDFFLRLHQFVDSANAMAAQKLDAVKLAEDALSDMELSHTDKR